MHRAWKTTIAIAIALWCCPPAAAQDKPADNGLTRIAEGVYVDTADPNGNAVSNSGVVVLEHSVVVYDTHFTPEAGQALASRIRAVTPNPVRYVVLGHFHPDHTHGTQAFASAPHVLSSSATRREMLQKDIPAMNRAVATTEAQVAKLNKEIAALRDPAQQEALRRQVRAREDFLQRMSRLKIVQPSLTVDDALAIVEGKRRLELRYLGMGHTEGDLVLYLPEEKVVFCGDLFFNKALPNTQDGNLLEWMKTLPELLKLDAETFVPGHGPVGTREDVKSFLSFLEELKQMVEAGVNRGDSVEQLIGDSHVPARSASWQFQNFFPANLQKMYTELKALQLAAPPADSEGGRKPERERPKP